jgi:hypothetical protein
MKTKNPLVRHGTPNSLLDAENISPKAMVLAQQVQQLGIAALDDTEMSNADALRALMGATLTVCTALMEPRDLGLWLLQLSEESDACKPADSGQGQ